MDKPEYIERQALIQDLLRRNFYPRCGRSIQIALFTKVVEISYKIGSQYRQLAGFIIDTGTRYSFDGIGKTVFLTREEAETEIKRRTRK